MYPLGISKIRKMMLNAVPSGEKEHPTVRRVRTNVHERCLTPSI